MHGKNSEMQNWRSEACFKEQNKVRTLEKIGAFRVSFISHVISENVFA